MSLPEMFVSWNLNSPFSQGVLGEISPGRSSDTGGRSRVRALGGDKKTGVCEFTPCFRFLRAGWRGHKRRSLRPERPLFRDTDQLATQSYRGSSPQRHRLPVARFYRRMTTALILLLLRNPDDFPSRSARMAKPTPENHRGHPRRFLPTGFPLSAFRFGWPNSCS